MERKTDNIKTIILLGSLWGICEASIGHILHFLPYGFSGMIMVPIGFYFMHQAAVRNRSKSAVLWVGLVAAMIKCVDLLLPARSPMAVINPATAIMLESLLLFAFLNVPEKKRTFIPVFVMGILWISLFTLFQALIFKPSSGLYLQAPPVIAAVFLLTAIVSAGLITLYLKKSGLLFLKINVEKIPYAVPALSLLLALTMEYVISMIM